jgi:hypothetical protein
MDAPVYKAERIDDHIMFNCYLNNMMVHNWEFAIPWIACDANFIDKVS